MPATGNSSLTCCKPISAVPAGHNLAPAWLAPR
jgi:hypothetical protein